MKLTTEHLKNPLATLEAELRNVKRIADQTGQPCYVGSQLIDRWMMLLEAETLAMPSPRAVVDHIVAAARPINDGAPEHGWRIEDAVMRRAKKCQAPELPEHLMAAVKSK